MDDLIVLKQLPVIEERLHALKDHWEQQALDAEAMVCTEETIQAVKSFRAEMRKEFEDVDALRKQVKKAVLEPYETFELAFKECVTDPFRRADGTYAGKVSEVETDMKRRCEDGLRDYFAELCAVHHLDWLTYEQSGIKVDMASARAKTPTKLRKQLADFVTYVGDSVDHINELDNAEEIMVEFQRTLDAAGAIYTVQERHRRIEEERTAQEVRKATQDQESEAVRRVEALAPPVQVEPEKAYSRVSLVFFDVTDRQLNMMKPFLRELKKIADMEGIKYE